MSSGLRKRLAAVEMRRHCPEIVLIPPRIEPTPEAIARLHADIERLKDNPRALLVYYTRPDGSIADADAWQLQPHHLPAPSALPIRHAALLDLPPPPERPRDPGEIGEIGDIALARPPAAPERPAPPAPLPERPAPPPPAAVIGAMPSGEWLNAFSDFHGLPPR